MRIFSIVLTILLMLGLKQINANDTQSINNPKNSECFIVEVGAYPLSLRSFNLHEGAFDINFHVWWRTKSADYNPIKSVEVANSKDFKMTAPITIKEDNYFITKATCSSTVLKNWNPKYFPFDRQILKVSLEDMADVTYVKFIPDKEKSAIHNELQLPGWKILSFKIEDSLQKYDTNFGFTKSQGDVYSRICFSIEMKREGFRILGTYFIGFFVAFLLCLVSFSIDKNDLDKRIGVIVGGIFSSVGNKYVVDNMLTLTAEITLADIIQLATYFVLLVSIGVAIFSVHSRLALTKEIKIEKTIMASMAIFYCGLIGYWLMKAVNS